jgi:phage head maturation protease
MSTFTPRGWRPGLVEKRFSDKTPSSYNKADNSCECIISTGAGVARFYGTETLKISKDAVDLSRMKSSGIPVLDSHQGVGINNALGKVQQVWFEGSALMGRIKFNKTPEGKKAEGMAARGEIAGISAGYSVEKWQVSDSDGRVIDTDTDAVRWDDNLTFQAVKWSLHEVSMVSTPADAASMIRSLDYSFDPASIENVRARILAKERMYMRQRMIEAQSKMYDERGRDE